MNWRDIEAHWPQLKKGIRDGHPDLDTDALEQTPEGRRQLMQLIEAKYGAAQPVSDADVDDIFQTGNTDNGTTNRNR